MEQPFRILLADELDADSEERLSAAGELLRERNCTEEALCRAIRGCDGFVVRTHVKVTRRVLEAGAKLKVVGVAGVGTDNVDVRAAEELGIRILHTPAASSDAVAEFTVGLMLNLQRGIARLAEAYRRGGFAGLRRRTYGVELCEQTIGIIGMGRIGSRVGRICSAGFGARVLYNDIIDVGPFPFEAESVSKEIIWAESDLVTLHVPAHPRIGRRRRFPSHEADGVSDQRGPRRGRGYAGLDGRTQRRTDRRSRARRGRSRAAAPRASALCHGKLHFDAACRGPHAGRLAAHVRGGGRCGRVSKERGWRKGGLGGAELANQLAAFLESDTELRQDALGGAAFLAQQPQEQVFAADPGRFEVGRFVDRQGQYVTVVGGTWQAAENPCVLHIAFEHFIDGFARVLLGDIELMQHLRSQALAVA